MALGLTQPLTQRSTKGKELRGGGAGGGGRCVGLTTLPTSFAGCLQIMGASTSCSPKDQSWLYSDSFLSYTELNDSE